VADPAGWRRATGGAFAKDYILSGESLKRPPQGVDPDHALIDDLKRKSFVGLTELPERTVTSDDFVAELARMCRTGAPLVRFLCQALDVPF
jgi:uncharacterized protein (DUF2461 family)